MEFVHFWDAEKKKGWPDMNDPLPTNPQEWVKKAEDYTSKQEICFWAAKDVPGAPRPGKAGTKESLTLDKLAPGTYYFALVAWDGNLSSSPTSNGVSAQVK